MSGVGMVLAGDGPYGGGGGAPLSLLVTWTGATTINVSGASGVINSGVIGFNPSGGTPPYSGDTIAVQNDASGKIGIAASSDGIHNTLSWSGFSLNETEGCTIHGTIQDSTGASASGNAPGAGIIVIKRTS